MAKQKPAETISQQLRRIIDDCELSRYEICRRVGLDQGQLSKFMAGNMSFSQQKIDALGTFFAIRLEAKPPKPEKRKPQAKKGRTHG